LQEALAAGGFDVAFSLDAPLELHARVAELRPDVVLIETESPSRDVIEQLAAMKSDAPRPVIMFSDDAENDVIRRVLRAGVTTYVVDGLSPARLQPILTVAIERFEAEQAMKRELDEARTQLADRKDIERAKGIIQKQRKVDEDEAFASLRKLAMDRNVTLGEAARQVVEIAKLLG
jgi:response regulator NasT